MWNQFCFLILNKIVAMSTRRCKMRATLSGYYRNLNFDQSKVTKELFDVTKQISSGQKIEYAYDDPSTFVNTMRLDNEVTTLMQVKENSTKALQFSTNSDTTMNDMTKVLEAMKVKLLAASTDSNSRESLDAIANELRGLESNLIQMANTSIDGKYLFSGSKIDDKPIGPGGVYQGNGEDLKAFVGSGVEQIYNVSGADLFLGEENDTKRKVTLNMPHLNQTLLYPDVMIASTLSRDQGEEEHINEESTIRDLMGDNDANIDTVNVQHHFYVRGTNHEGQAFKEIISMRDDESVSDLMVRIGTAYGNVASNQLVEVSLNKHGQIEIEDKRPGSSKLDFHMVANTDLAGPVNDIDLLNTNGSNVVSFMQSNYTEFTQDLGQHQDIINPDIFTLSGNYNTQRGEAGNFATLLSDILPGNVTDIQLTGSDSATPANVLAPALFNVTAVSTLGDLVNAIEANFDPGGNLSFSIQNGQIVFDRTNGTAPGISINLQAQDAGVPVDGLPSNAAVAYNDTQFTKVSNKLIGNVSQIAKLGSTDINGNDTGNDFATDKTRLADVFDTIVPGTSSLRLEGVQNDGVTPYSIDLNLDNPVNVTGTLNFNVLNAAGGPTNAADMTYRQLMDVINFAITGTNPGAVAATYNAAIISVNNLNNVSLDAQGQIIVDQLTASGTNASLSIFDTNTKNFTNTTGGIASFNSNNSLEISDAKTNFFEQINAAIESVELGRLRADGNHGDPRNNGMQNAIQALDDLSAHLFSQHSVAGVHSSTLQTTTERTDLLIITTQTLRSETIDVDLAEASLELKQLELNYQAMLSSVSRISQLSLVNYI